jgi:hypothetical protein
MKYLKRIFENSEIESLLYSLEEYNKLLYKDDIWKNYFKNIKDIKSKSREDLDEILKFAENRWEEVKKEIEENIQEVKDIYLSYLEDSKSISDYSIKRLSNVFYNDQTLESNYLHLIELKLIFSNKTIEERTQGSEGRKAFSITSDEVFDYWKSIYDFFSVLKSNSYEPCIKYYQQNGVEMIILINMK